MNRVAVIGAGVSGLGAALRLARAGARVTLFDSRGECGGLAGGVEYGACEFDAGPYVLLDRPGLAWAFERLGLSFDAVGPLETLDPVYVVSRADAADVTIRARAEDTASGLERNWPGSGERYLDFVRRMERVHADLAPMQRMRPSPLNGLRTGAWRRLPFLARTLGSVLRGAQLPQPVADAISIWTYVAGHTPRDAPSIMALVPAVFHSQGAYRPAGGLRTITAALEHAVRDAGVDVRLESRVDAIQTEAGRVRAVRVSGERISVEAVVSCCGAHRTYLDLLDETPSRVEKSLTAMPLQSPGVCAYLRVTGRPHPYLQFWLPSTGESTRLLIAPPAEDGGHRYARLLAPMAHEEAEKLDEAAQIAHLDRLLAERWWQKDIDTFEVVGRRCPSQWGAEYGLHRDAMNPTMTRALMLRGRIAHRSPSMKGLYLAGSSTHPGQWVSFCVISGVLAAECLLGDGLI